MQNNAQKIKAACQKGLAFFWLHGDDKQQQYDLAPMVIQHHKEQGFTLKKYTADATLHWKTFHQHLHQDDLFIEKTLIWLDNPSGKWPTEAKNALKAFADNASAEQVLFITSGKLSKSQTQAKWFKACTQEALVITLYPLQGQAFVQWIKTKAEGMQLNMQPDAIEALMRLTEGHPTATHQALARLCLLGHHTAIDATTLTRLCSDQSLYHAYHVVDAFYEGNTAHLLHLITRLEAHLVEPTLMLWQCSQSLRELITLLERHARGEAIAHLVQTVWRSKQHALRCALQGITLVQAQYALQQCALLDAAIKGRYPTRFWPSLRSLLVALSERAPLSQWTTL